MYINGLFTSGELLFFTICASALLVSAAFARFAPSIDNARLHDHIAVLLGASFLIGALLYAALAGHLDNAWALVDYYDAKDGIRRDIYLGAAENIYIVATTISAVLSPVLANRRGHSKIIWATYGLLFSLIPLFVLLLGRPKRPTNA